MNPEFNEELSDLIQMMHCPPTYDCGPISPERLLTVGRLGFLLIANQGHASFTYMPGRNKSYEVFLSYPYMAQTHAGDTFDQHKLVLALPHYFSSAIITMTRERVAHLDVETVGSMFCSRNPHDGADIANLIYGLFVGGFQYVD